MEQSLAAHHDQVDCDWPEETAEELTGDSQTIGSPHIAVGNHVLALLSGVLPSLPDCLQLGHHILVLVLHLLLSHWHVGRIKYYYLRFQGTHLAAEYRVVEQRCIYLHYWQVMLVVVG